MGKVQKKSFSHKKNVLCVHLGHGSKVYAKAKVLLTVHL